MKNTLLNFIIFISLISSFSCRRGDEDPAITLRSRDNRLENTWALVDYSGTATYTYQYNGLLVTETVIYSYSNNILTSIYSNDLGQRWVDSYFYSVNMTINKDGTMSASIREDNAINNIDDSWFWLNTAKNKSKVFLGSYRLSEMGSGEFNVLRLANKELKLVAQFSDIYTSGNFRDVLSQDIVWTFRAQ
jgi:hypothetical protein